MARQAEGTQGIIPCGTTGESATFEHEEQHRVIGEVVQVSAGRMKVIAGAGSNSTSEAVSLAQAAERLGADGVLTITPYYNKPNQEGLFQHFKAVREATKLPYVLYNVPGRTGVNLLPETTARVQALGNLAGVKESTGNCEQVQEMVERGIPVLSGDDNYPLPFMALGAVGVISVVANFAPRIMRQYVDACARSDAPESRAPASPSSARCTRRPSATHQPHPGRRRRQLAALGKCREEYRLPMVPMAPGKKDALIAALKKHRIL